MAGMTGMTGMTGMSVQRYVGVTVCWCDGVLAGVSHYGVSHKIGQEVNFILLTVLSFLQFQPVLPTLMQQFGYQILFPTFCE